MGSALDRSPKGAGPNAFGWTDVSDRLREALLSTWCRQEDSVNARLGGWVVGNGPE